jgi:hypothetical protein
MRPLLLSFCFVASSFAAPPVPSGGHPRLFMSPSQLMGYTKNAATSGSAADSLVKQCQDTLTEPKMYDSRGGSDGNYWPGSAVSCAFAYLATQKQEYLTQALKYWQASLDDDQSIGDKKGCVSGVDPNWKAWDGSPPAPPVILTVTHDTTYPMRWYGPDIALTYDWLYSAPGVTDSLRSQTRTCLAAWSDFYTAKGYHNDEPGANYNAGFVIGKTLTAIAIGNDGSNDGHLWTETVDDMFPKLFVQNGLAMGAKPGPMVGGDWLEGWQYGALSVLEYAVATRALEENGATEPEMDQWTSSLAVRYLYATTPSLDGQWSNGDLDIDTAYFGPSANVLDAVLAGPSSDQAASWALQMKQTQQVQAGSYVYNAIAELRAVQPEDFKSTNPPLYYLSRGSRVLYARTSWDASAYWGVFSSPPQLVSDHEHLAAGNFSFSRGGDHLIVDSSRYGEGVTFETNAIAVECDLMGDYSPAQTPWSQADLPWARGTADGVYAARSDFTDAFIFSSGPSHVDYAHREWVMLPEGEIVTIDRVLTKDAMHHAILNFHVNGTLNNGMATIGGSQLALHTVRGPQPTLLKPGTTDCNLSCSYPCAQCNQARIPVDEVHMEVPGPWAVAINVFDGLGAGEMPANVGAIDDATYDPNKENAAVIGAAVYRSSKQSYVIASSAMQGMAGDTMTYTVPGDSAARHIVFDAPEGSDGNSLVTVAPENGRCKITITAGMGFTGHPLMFQVGKAADGCMATDGTNAPSASPPPGKGIPPGQPKPSNNVQGGCGCVIGGQPPIASAILLACVATFAFSTISIRRRLRRK